MKSKLERDNKLKKDAIIHETLPEGFIERIKKYKEILKEVENITLEEAISNFQKELNPETELLFYENMAVLYKVKSESGPTLTIEGKQRLYKDIFVNRGLR